MQMMDGEVDANAGVKRLAVSALFVVVGLIANPWVVGFIGAKDHRIDPLRPVQAIVVTEVLVIGAGFAIAAGRSRRWVAVVAGVVAVGLVTGAWFTIRKYRSDVGRIRAAKAELERTGSDQAILGRALNLDRGPIAKLASESSGLLHRLHHPVEVVTVTVPEGGVLDTAIGIDPLVQAFFNGTLSFRIEAREPNGERKPLFSKSFDLRTRREAASFRWTPVTVDLAAFAGRTFDLAFEIRFRDGNGRKVFDLAPVDLAFWRDPQVRPRRLEGRKNVILISVDTLRADHLHFMGYKRETSPRLDALAADGVVFEQTISQAPWTTPAHFSILTGTYPSTHGVDVPVTTWPFAGGPTRNRNRQIPTLATMLRNEGYVTAAFTGMGPISASVGFYEGFDSYAETSSAGKEEGKQIKFGLSDSKEVVEKATKWIAQHRDRSFFLFVHTFEVHQPYTNDYFVDKEGISEDDEAAHQIARYDGDIRFADEQLGKLLDDLRDRGLLENTLVVLTSDHGEELDAGTVRGASFKIGHGHNLYDEVLHVPLVFRGLGVEPKSRRIPFQVRSIDIVPTILDDLGIAQPDLIEGESLLPLIRGEAGADRPAYSEATTFGTQRESLRIPGLKYVYRISYGELAAALSKGLPLTPLHELYDLRSDPGEIHNLAGSQAELMADMTRQLDAIRPERKPLAAVEGEAPAPDIGHDEDLMESLRSLGYIQ